MQPSIPRIAIVLLAVGAVAVAAAGVLFGGPAAPIGDADRTPAEQQRQTPEPPDIPESPIAWLAGAVHYVFGGALAILALVSVIALYRNFSTPEPADPGSDFDREPLEFEPTDLDSIADAAGRAADRIERGGAIDNEVYRAWKEMTDFLSVRNRRARTPGEFAAVAVRAGMDPDDVEALTELFEAARYGTTDPSEAEQRRAVDILRRIESKHGGVAE